MAENALLNDWTSAIAEGRNELVFEGKNKNYGAYDLRKKYNRTVNIALLITGLSFIFIVSFPMILDWIQQQTEELVVPVDNTVVDLTAPPPIDEAEPPPPPPPPPPVMETVKFTPPVVTDDEVIDEPPPLQTEETPQISTETQEGTGDDIIIIPDEGTGIVAPVKDEIFTIVEQMPSFPGGDAAMMKWIRDKIEAIGYPQMEKEAGISGTCYVTFVIDKDGNVVDSKILRGVSGGPGYDKVALTVVKAMPKWAAGKQNGRSVSVQYNLPIKFTIR
ncbi:MAG: TonB family protein [Bacteroidota bacterium]|nr:TonB family protein [Bacteroidia bacterium]